MQQFFLAEWKQKSNFVLALHSFIWAMGVGVALIYLGLFNYWLLAMLFFGHYIIDAWKCQGWYKKGVLKKYNISDKHSYYIDHALHFIQLLICVL